MLSSRNQTIQITDEERQEYIKQIVFLDDLLKLQLPNEQENRNVLLRSYLKDKVICADIFDLQLYLPKLTYKTAVCDPPYNLLKNYNGTIFKELEVSEYKEFTVKWMEILWSRMLNPFNVFFCADWKTSNIIYPVLSRHLTTKNRITWEREKGRGSKNNWKNNMEDIWHFTHDEPEFYVDQVMQKRKVIAPYKDQFGQAKDWEDGLDGKHRLTYPSNIWTDMTVPFWSMPENTPHPTQKPEKLVAKLILSTTKENDWVLDPFGGSGTTASVAVKLNRNFTIIEKELEYCLLAVKRIEMAKLDSKIQGYDGKHFLDRNMGV